MALLMTRAPRQVRSILLASLAATLLASLVLVHSASSQERYRADTVKAAFLYRFAGYVEWPKQALETDHFTIAILGSTEVASELEKLLPERRIKNLPGRVRQVHRLRDVGTPHILYIAAGHRENLRVVTDTLGSKSILIVTDDAEGLDHGSADRRVRFEISVTAAHKAQLRIGAELLSVAARVRGAPERADALCDACLCSEQICLAATP
jgi:hypothetical protein